MRRLLYQPTGTEHLAELPTRTYCGRRLTGPWITWDDERRVSWSPRSPGQICQKCESLAEADPPEVAEAPGWTGKLGYNEPGAQRSTQRLPGAD
jgi:hypothetical protein